MSIKALCIVLHANIVEIDSNTLSVLVRLADSAHDNGTNARQAVETVAIKTKLSVRTVQKALAVLEDERLIKRTREGRGRGLCASWAINLALIETYRVHASKREADEVPDFNDADKRCTTRTFYDGEKVHGLHEKVHEVHEKVHEVHPTLLEPIKILSARGASARPKGRSPRCPDDSAPHPSAANGSGKRSGVQGAGGVAPRTTGRQRRGARWVGPNAEDLCAQLDVKVDRRGYEAWASLVLAVVRRGEIDAARAWLCRRNIVEVTAQCDIIVANQLAFDRINQTFGALLAEQGWRVAMSGAGG